MRHPAFIAAVLLTIAASVAPADVVVNAPSMTLTLSDAATWQSVVMAGDDRDFIDDTAPTPIADVSVDGKTHRARALTQTDGGIRVEFEGTDTVLLYDLTPAEHWVSFRLARIEGSRPERMTLLRIPVSIRQQVGGRLNCAWDDERAVCLLAANRQVDCRASASKVVTLNASTQDAPGPAMEGAAVALIVAPTDEFRTVARDASHAFGLLTNEDADGTPAKNTDLVRGSYFFLSFGETEVGKAVEYCKLAGINQVMLGSGAWCQSVGHYLFSESRYPSGIEGLKAVVDELHANGILVGMHTFVSKISKIDPYVTPVPDKRFWRQFETKLAGDITADQTDIKVAADMDLSQWAGSSETRTSYWEGGASRHREVVIGDEIIQYDSVGPEGTWDTFYGCKRGAWGTSPAAHRAGDDAVHFGVDGCINGYIIDQETDLMDEVAERIAGIFNYCGFDMVYFDGGEDVDRRRFSHYVSNFQEQAVKRFEKRPLIHMGTIMTHLLWHSFARSSTVDTYLNTLGGAIVGGRGPDTWKTVKQHINVSVDYMVRISADMMPGELGWFGIWPQGSRGYARQLDAGETEKYGTDEYKAGVQTETECTQTVTTFEPPNELKVVVEYDGLQFDEMEYLMCKSLAYDAAVSLQTSFDQMESHALTPELLGMFRLYEELRMARAIPPDVCEKLRERDADFAMVNLNGERSFARLSRLPRVGGEREFRALVGEFGNGSVATLWHTSRAGKLTVAIPPKDLQAVTLIGEPVALEADGDRTVIPVGQTRTTLICESLSVDDLTAALEAAETWVKPPMQIVVPASSFTRLVGKMARGSQAGVEEPEAGGDVIVCTGQPSLGIVEESYAEYTVDVPHDGIWTLYARVRYPSGADHSFGIVRPGEEVTLQGTQVLGNCGVNEKKWHWTGRGGGSTTAPPGQPITLKLEKGPFTFRIYAREGGGTTATNPRLSEIRLIDEAGILPTDAE